MRKNKNIYFYTDGACSGNPGKGGWAFVELLPTDNGFKLSTQQGNKPETTNNEMELTAVYMALVKAYKSKIKQVTIFSDSAYVVSAITKGWLVNWYNNGWKTKEYKPVKNKHIWEKMYKLLFEKGMKVEFIKVKGHDGEPLNELADRKAVEAKEAL